MVRAKSRSNCWHRIMNRMRVDEGNESPVEEIEVILVEINENTNAKHDPL